MKPTLTALAAVVAALSNAQQTPQAALDYLAAQTDIGGWRVTKVETDDLRMTHVWAQQKHGELDVYGSEAVLHIDQRGRLSHVSDYFARGFRAIGDPRVSRSESVGLATFHLLANKPAVPEDVHAVTLHGLRDEDGRDRLAYLVEFAQCDGGEPAVWVDAVTAQVFMEWNNEHTGASVYEGNVQVSGNVLHQGNFYLEDATYRMGVMDGLGSHKDSDRARISAPTNGWDGPGHAPALDLWLNLHRTYWYYVIRHAQHGMDGSGGYSPETTVTGAPMITARVHAAVKLNGETTPNNAKFSTLTKFMAFGDGDGETFGPLVSLDVVAHEFTHGVIHSLARLPYLKESGALNESLADVFAVMVEHYRDGENPDIWLIGEECFTPGLNGDALRSLTDPEAFGDPDHYSERFTGTGDSGGVHTNSGIPNKAFSLVAIGGGHSNKGANVRMNGIGLEKAAKIWYRAMRYGIRGFTRFNDMRRETRQAAKDLYGNSSVEKSVVEQAWEWCGV